MKQIILILSMVFALGNLARAQSTELGILGGVSLYSGDLSEDEFGLYFENLKPAFGIFGRFNLSNTLAIRLGVSHGQVQEESDLRGSDEYMRNFRSNITEFALTAEINLFRIGRTTNFQAIPFIFGGGAVFNFRPETLFDGNWIEMQPLGTEGQGLPGYEQPYQLTQIAIPVGLGLKLDMGNWAMSFEFGGRKLFTDHLDDISNASVSYQDVYEGNGELAAMISNPIAGNDGEPNPTYNRGGPFDDWYYIGGVTLSFDIGGGYGGRGSGRNIGCPTF
ncbi:DUF6089 family protein [Flavilitoribacter nigricans]|nr:DUF6089 family protein [Flavilitoribacter nigricans]